VRPLRRAGTVIFDCDSTLAAIEGIEAIALAHRPEIERLTEAAMAGEVPLEQVYGRRLELVRPSRARVEALAAEYIAALVPDAREVVAALRAEGVAIRIVSAGLLPAVRGLAPALGLAHSDVAAVDIRFDMDGRYAGFDTASPLTRSGGKAELIAAWREELRSPLMLVGDGVTDLEAYDVVDLFVAYAGVAARDVVVSGADVVVRTLSLAPILPLALAGEPPRNGAGLVLFEKGLALLAEEYRALMPQSSTAEQ